MNNEEQHLEYLRKAVAELRWATNNLRKYYEIECRKQGIVPKQEDDPNQLSLFNEKE